MNAFDLYAYPNELTNKCALPQNPLVLLIHLIASNTSNTLDFTEIIL